MNELSDEILEKFRNKKVAIFIDDANLFYMQKRIGWEIDWQKTKQFFEKYTTNSQWFYYLGMPLAGKGRFENEKLKEELSTIGFSVKTKLLKKFI
ncbi:MAG: NYN domain-containing protein [Patescibacteria group bacterium]